jgi:hypothetical protein
MIVLLVGQFRPRRRGDEQPIIREADEHPAEGDKPASTTAASAEAQSLTGSVEADR